MYKIDKLVSRFDIGCHDFVILKHSRIIIDALKDSLAHYLLLWWYGNILMCFYHLMLIIAPGKGKMLYGTFLELGQTISKVTMSWSW